MRKFIISDSIALSVGEYYYDLHNNYDFIGIKLLKTTTSAVVEINFNKKSEDWVKKVDPMNIVLKFENVSQLAFSDAFLSCNSKIVERIGYKDLGDENYDLLLTEEQSTPQSDLLIFLENDEFVRINAEEGTVIIE